MKTKLLTTAIAFLLGMGMGQNAHADLKDGLVAHWSFDDCRATDNSGNGHDGTLNGNPQCVDGVKGKAFSFDGSNGIQIDNVTNIPIASSSRTISAWVKQETGNDSNNDQFFIGYGDTKSKQMFALVYGVGSSYDFGVWLYGCDNDLSCDEGNPNTITDRYYHLVATYDESYQRLQTYINGVAYKNKIVAINTNSSKISIGQYNYNGQPLQSIRQLDDLRIYNRALTEAEVLELYNGAIQPKETVQISGKIKFGSQAGKGVTLSGEGLTEECLTDLTGKFNCKITKGWTGFLTPESKGVSFSPPRISVTDAQTNLEVKTPLVGTTTDSFPLNGVMTSDWVKLKTDKATWQVETSTGASDDKTAHEGRFSFGSAKIGVNQTAAIETTINVTQAGQLSFARRVSSNPEHGVLNFEISGKQKNGTWKTLITEKSSGDVAWEMKNYALTVGQFKLRWTYAKDGAEAKGEDKAWIDAVSYPSSVKVAAKTCEGITAGTVKLMTIKNPTCDQLQAYMVWSKSTRPSRFDEAESFSKDIKDIEASHEWWQNFIKDVGRIYAFLSPGASKTVVDGVVDSVANLQSEAIGIVCDKAITNTNVYYQTFCEIGQETLTTYISEYLKSFASGAAMPSTFAAAVPYAVEKAFSISSSLIHAGSVNATTNEINSFNLATDFLDEYYKGGSNQATLRAMAKKYGVENTNLDTLVDALAIAKGYDNGFADSIRLDFFGDEYGNETVVKSIESVMTKNKNSLNYYRNNLLKKPVQTTQPLLP